MKHGQELAVLTLALSKRLLHFAYDAVESDNLCEAMNMKAISDQMVNIVSEFNQKIDATLEVSND